MNPEDATLNDDSSLEFDKFEDMRLVLARVLVHEGRDALEAERIAFYVVQGTREVPKLLSALGGRSATDAEIRALLVSVIESAPSLDKARAMLLRL